MARLTPAPGRGAVLAAGAVVLTTFAVLFDARFAHQWDAGARLALFGALALVIATLAARAPMVGDTPLPYHATLQVAGIALTGLALLNLADTLGANGQFGGAGALVWTGLLLAALALSWARRTNSAIMTLLAALVGALTVVSFVRWAFHPHGVQTLRWILLLCALALAVGAVWLRDRARRHAVALVDVAGLAIVALGFLATLSQSVSGIVTSSSSASSSISGDGTTTETTTTTVSSHPVGWQLVLLAFGFGLIAYGAVDRERVPPFIGALCLAVFVLLAGPAYSAFVGWPLVLLLIGIALLVIGLRPRQELPPEPPVPPATLPPPPPTAPTVVVDP